MLSISTSYWQTSLENNKNIKEVTHNTYVLIKGITYRSNCNDCAKNMLRNVQKPNTQINSNNLSKKADR